MKAGTDKKERPELIAYPPQKEDASDVFKDERKSGKSEGVKEITDVSRLKLVHRLIWPKEIQTHFSLCLLRNNFSSPKIFDILPRSKKKKDFKRNFIQRVGIIKTDKNNLILIWHLVT